MRIMEPAEGGIYFWVLNNRPHSHPNFTATRRHFAIADRYFLRGRPIETGNKHAALLNANASLEQFPILCT